MANRWQDWEKQMVEKLHTTRSVYEILDVINHRRQELGLAERTEKAINLYCLRYKINCIQQRPNEFSIQKISKILGVDRNSLGRAVRRGFIRFRPGPRRTCFVTWESLARDIAKHPVICRRWPTESLRILAKHSPDPSVLVELRRWHERPRVHHRSGQVYPSITHASRALGVTRSTIHAWSKLPNPPVRICS